jgi:hypothetical protein
MWWASKMHQLNWLVGNRAQSVIEMGPGDRTPKYENALIETGQNFQPKVTSLPEHIMRLELAIGLHKIFTLRLKV